MEHLQSLECGQNPHSRGNFERLFGYFESQFVAFLGTNGEDVESFQASRDLK